VIVSLRHVLQINVYPPVEGPQVLVRAATVRATTVVILITVQEAVSASQAAMHLSLQEPHTC
jgi:hypothetical protein